MRLLNAESITLHEFQGSKIPKYAILSHTWGDDEVSFQDLQAGKGPGKEGYKKIVFTCRQALLHGLEWVWVDTCCIDKSSSAELSESINSMYRWYKESATCYAYLVDIVDINKFPYAPSTNNGKQQISRWFTRSWTLQELIAPQRVYFFGRDWKRIGFCEEKLANIVSEVTRISIQLIDGSKYFNESLSKFSVAQRMSWAAHRSSTRREDVAYSLMGLFNINMPLLYGEGDRAFTRLQDEILKETNDHSLLCWTVPERSDRAWTLQSVFAESPDDFAHAGHIKGNLLDSGYPSVVTNRGLQIYLPLTERQYNISSHLYHGNPGCSVFDAALDAGECEPHGDAIINRVSVQLVRTPQISSRHLPSVNRYARLATPELGCISINPPKNDTTRGMEIRAEMIYIHKTLFDWERNRFRAGGIHLQNLSIAANLSSRPHATCDGIVQINTIFYSGLAKEFFNITNTGVPPTFQGVTWSPIYNCIQFDRNDTGNLSLVVFGLDSSTLSIVLGWSEYYIQFGLCSDVRIMEDDDATLRQCDVPKYERNYWKMYGEIACARASIDSRDIEFVLVVEDSNAEDGKAAGNRLHFLIRAIDHSLHEGKGKGIKRRWKDNFQSKKPQITLGNVVQ
ncbi:HET-domain-containing protein [Annulohypoxylon nitens]|nr:HET-domain-containing protein [Annulohypoxylon nitens]